MVPKPKAVQSRPHPLRPPPPLRHLPSLPCLVPGINDAFRIWLTILVLIDRMEMYKCEHPLSNGQQFRLSRNSPPTHTHTRTRRPDNLRTPLSPRTRSRQLPTTNPQSGNSKSGTTMSWGGRRFRGPRIAVAGLGVEAALSLSAALPWGSDLHLGGRATDPASPALFSGFGSLSPLLSSSRSLFFLSFCRCVTDGLCLSPPHPHQ